jgi:hypothetical protein
VVIRWVQVVLFAVVVLLVVFHIWQREHSSGSNSIEFGLMAASALSIGVLERHRAPAAEESR